MIFDISGLTKAWNHIVANFIHIYRLKNQFFVILSLTIAKLERFFFANVLFFIMGNHIFDGNNVFCHTNTSNVIKVKTYQASVC